jgi:hypothetical protein
MVVVIVEPFYGGSHKQLGSILRNPISAEKNIRINYHPQILDKFLPINTNYNFI